MGPTATGKSDIAEALAKEYDGILINADSYQVYKGFDIGTNKPVNTEDYRLIDILEPEEDYGLGQFISDSHSVLSECIQSNKNAIFVGGTGYYLRGLFESYQDFAPPPSPELRAEACRLFEELGPEGMREKVHAVSPNVEVEWQNRHRACRAYERTIIQPTKKPPIWPSIIQKMKISIDIELEEHKTRINDRASQMVGPAWISEVQRLLDQNISLQAPSMKAIGYLQMAEVVQGQMNLEDAVTRIQELTWQYAKRQRTWLRSEPNINKINGEDSLAGILSQVRDLLSNSAALK